jgi:ligand-binding SRPBCC domain-containing protein
MMRTLETDLWLPRGIDDVFAFFGDAMNLERITPKFLNFRVLTPSPIAMGAGTLIDYRISLRGVPMRWRTLISAWEPPVRFVDEQLKGPYWTWIHEHTFEAEARGGVMGTRCRDVVRYDAPGGSLVHRLLVRPDLERIFRYRQAAMLEIMGGAAGQATRAREGGGVGGGVGVGVA